MMDIFCSRCGQADGATPDDHRCLANLRGQFDTLIKEFGKTAGVPPGAPFDFTRWPLDKLEHAQVQISTLHANIEAVQAYHLDQAAEHERKARGVNSSLNEARSYVNRVRSVMRDKLVDI